MRILVGLDGTPEASAAAGWAAALADAVASTLAVATVFESAEAERTPRRAEELRRERTARLTHLVERDGLDPARCTLRALEGRPLDQLAALAARSQPDVVIIGSKPFEGISRLALGSLAHGLLHHLECPLVMVPVSAPALAGGHVLVCDDGTTGGQAAVQWATNLASAVAARVRVTWPAAHHPAATLRRLAERVHAGLLVVPARSEHSLDGRLLGALPDALVHHPTCPVAVLPYAFLLRGQDALLAAGEP